MAETLKPCPFCGNKEPYFERMGTSRQSCIVECGNCGCRHESSDEGENSGRQWNERTGPRVTRSGFTDDMMDMADRQGATSASGKPACEHCGGTGETFVHAEDCTDDLCALNGDQHSCTGKLEPCSCSAPTAPDIPPGFDMARGWCVQVLVYGETILTIEEQALSGVTDLDPWASTIRGCAEHLQAFIGPAGGGASFDPDAPLETGEADAKEPHPCAHGCRHALNGEGLAHQCIVGCRRAMKEGIKK